MKRWREGHRKIKHRENEERERDEERQRETKRDKEKRRETKRDEERRRDREREIERQRQRQGAHTKDNDVCIRQAQWPLGWPLGIAALKQEYASLA